MTWEGVQTVGISLAKTQKQSLEFIHYSSQALPSIQLRHRISKSLLYLQDNKVPPYRRTWMREVTKGTCISLLIAQPLPFPFNYCYWQGTVLCCASTKRLKRHGLRWPGGQVRSHIEWRSNRKRLRRVRWNDNITQGCTSETKFRLTTFEVAPPVHTEAHKISLSQLISLVFSLRCQLRRMRIMWWGYENGDLIPRVFQLLPFFSKRL